MSELAAVDLPAGLEIRYDPRRRDVILGAEIAAEGWRFRRAAELRPVLAPDAVAALDPDEPLYSMVNGVYRQDDVAAARQHPWRYELTVLPPRQVGREYVKTLGHIHSMAPGGTTTYAEVYEVLLGVAHFIFFRVVADAVAEVVVVEAEAGDRVVVPPGYHHLSVNPGAEAMVFADLIDRAAATDYTWLQDHGGAPYLCMAGAGGPHYERNGRYPDAPPPRHVRARHLAGHLALPPLPLYRMAFEAPQALAFLSDPAPYGRLFGL